MMRWPKLALITSVVILLAAGNPLPGAHYRVSVDAARIIHVADSLHVRPDVALMTAWMETRDGTHWNALGPGVIDSTWLADGTLRIKRICRERGRYQMRSCIDWVKELGDPRCTLRALTFDHDLSIVCGIENLAHMHLKYGNWLEVVHHQNGGPAYWPEAFAYGEWLHLTGNDE